MGMRRAHRFFGFHASVTMQQYYPGLSECDAYEALTDSRHLPLWRHSFLGRGLESSDPLPRSGTRSGAAGTLELSRR